MDLLSAFRTFVRVAETRSFSAVARETGLSQPAVSRQIAALEEHLSVRLMQRTTRSVRLTEDGEALLGHAREVLHALEETRWAIGQKRSGPAGRVRLAAPAGLGASCLIPRLQPLFDDHPGLQVELAMREGSQDMVAEGIDVAIRAGAVTGQTLVARRIGALARVAVASPLYLSQRGMPHHPRELVRHDCILFLGDAAVQEWNFNRGDEVITASVTGRFATDSGEAAREAACSGLGCVLLPECSISDDLDSGRLRTVLPGWTPAPLALHAVYPSRRNLPPRTRAVIDFLVEAFRERPVPELREAA